MNFFQAVGSFLSGVIVVWITQQIISSRERRRKIEDTKLSIYMAWIPFFADVYASAAYPDKSPIDPRDFLKKKMEILGILQLMGPDGAMDAFLAFCDDAEKSFQRDPAFDAGIFHRRFTELNFQLCCEIHSENANQTKG
jgi:hypothetical protein